jgi:hypothetical protein
MTRKFYSLVAAAIVLATLLPLHAAALECGDVDRSGAVGASDALHLLQYAVGIEGVQVACPFNCVSTTTSTTSTTSTTTTTLPFYVGNWEGDLFGDDVGTFAGRVDALGRLSGTGVSFLAGPFSVRGTVSGSGSLAGVISSGATMSGSLRSNGTGSGTYRNDFYDVRGTWTAIRTGP